MTKAEQFALCWERAKAIVQARRAEAPDGCDPVASWVAVVGGAVSIGGSLLSASMQSDSAGAASSAISGSNAFGSVPKAAEYKPVNFDHVPLDSIIANARNRQPLYSLVGANNDEVSRQAMARAKRFIPNYKSLMQTYSSAGGDLLHGQLPYDDVLGIVSNRNELANQLGTPGTSGAATLKDLGMSRLGAIQQGGGILKDMVGMAETISPISRYDSPASWMIKPLDRVQLEMQQRQLVQQSDQNRNNLEAAGDPAAYAQLQLALAQAGAGGGGAGAASAIGGLGQLLPSLFKSGSFGGGGGSSSTVPDFVVNQPGF